MPSIAGIDRQMIQGLFTGAVSEEDILESLFQTIPLRQAANGGRIEWENPLVIRSNGERAMRVQCYPRPGHAVENARQSIAAQIEAIPLPEGYSLRWEGEYQASNQAMTYLFMYYPGCSLMVAILIMLFKDVRKPLIIILCMPLLYQTIGHLISANHSVCCYGCSSRIGRMLIKNGIVLMDEITLQLSGMDPVKALMDSSENRFRPVVAHPAHNEYDSTTQRCSLRPVEW